MAQDNAWRGIALADAEWDWAFLNATPLQQSRAAMIAVGAEDIVFKRIPPPPEHAPYTKRGARRTSGKVKEGAK